MGELYKALDEEFAKSIARLNEAHDNYFKKYGEDSLDRVITHDPGYLEHVIDTAEELQHAINNFNKGAEMLEEAVKNNKPLEQIPEEMWKKIIF